MSNDAILFAVRVLRVMAASDVWEEFFDSEHGVPYYCQGTECKWSHPGQFIKVLRRHSHRSITGTR